VQFAFALRTGDAGQLPDQLRRVSKQIVECKLRVFMVRENLTRT